MSVQMINTEIKPGCCPHGLPSGACPVCSGMSGGGGIKQADKPQKKVNEWSYSRCYAFWQMMKANEAQKEANLQSLLAFKANMAAFQKNVATLIDKINVVISQLQSKLPAPVTKALDTISQKILIPVLNMIKNLPNNIQKVFNNIKTLLSNAYDKLTALFGELKNSIEKRLQKTLKNLKKKFISLLAIFNIETADDEDEKRIDEAKRLFKFKKLENTILNMTWRGKNEQY